MKLLTASEELRRINADILAPENAADEVQLLLEQHPDLMVYRSKDNVIYCSASVNSYVTMYDQTETTDGPPEAQHIYVWPYLMSMGRKVYSNPPYFCVGRNNDRGFGVEPQQGWDDFMEQVQIPNTLSRKIRSYLKSKPPISYT